MPSIDIIFGIMMALILVVVWVLLEFRGRHDFVMNDCVLPAFNGHVCDYDCCGTGWSDEDSLCQGLDDI